MIRSQYVDLDAADEPPYPLKGMGDLIRPIADIEQKLRADGLFIAIAQTDATGDVDAVSIVQTPSEEMAKLATSVIFRTKFKPAQCSGHPCAMDFTIRISFDRQ